MTVETRNRLIFYLALPAAVGFLLGANRTGIGTFLPWWASVVFWVSCTVASWWGFHAGTLIAAYLLRPWEPPLVVKLALGLLLASLPVRIMINNYVRLYETLMLEGRVTQPIPEAALTPEFVIGYLQTWSGAYVVWIAANFFFDRVVGMSRYRDRPKHASGAAPSAGSEAFSFTLPRTTFTLTPGNGAEVLGDTTVPGRTASSDTPAPSATAPRSQTVSALLSSLPRSLGLNIVAMKSEDHYLRVYTDRGDTLILYKLSTAMEELKTLGFDGLQVHRSHWVRKEAVERSEARGRQVYLIMSTGIAVPVSQTYREIVRMEGLLDPARGTASRNPA